jgi:cytoplasmic iron level regulating protein YaaA (DUF328/UPF0246 family)
MSTKLACGEHKSLYSYWGSTLTDGLNAELAGMAAGPGKFVLNVASQEYAKSVNLGALDAPVVTAVFPGPAVYAKQARGEMVRFCAERQLREPKQLTEFCGTSGEWRYLPGQSTETNLVFHRGAAAPKPKAAPAAKKAAATEASPGSNKRSRK